MNSLPVAYTWACMQAHQWGWSWSYETDGMIWVQTGSNEIGCSDEWDFVRFVSENIERAS